MLTVAVIPSWGWLSQWSDRVSGSVSILPPHDPAATLDDLRQAVTTLEEIERTARRVFGGAHPTTEEMEVAVRDARTVLSAREA